MERFEPLKKWIRFEGEKALIFENVLERQEMEEKMRCVIYSRVSTEEQTTDNQLRQLREYADRQSWNIIEEIQDVASGGNPQKNAKGSKKFLPWHDNGNSMFCYFGRWIGSAVRVAGKLLNI